MQIMLAVKPPVLTPYYDIIMWILIIEFVLVIILGGVGIALQSILAKRRKHNQKAKQELHTRLLHMVRDHTPFKASQFSGKLLSISCMLPVILEIDKKEDSEAWQALKIAIAEQHLLPQARKLTYRHRWTKKLKAIRCFALLPKIKDEKEILYLLTQQAPVIKYSAAHAAATLGTETAFHAILENMLVCTRYLRHPFHDAFKKGGEKGYQYLTKRLEVETDPYARVDCIELLTDQMSPPVASLLEKDLYATHLNLRIAAIRALGHLKSTQSIQLLVPLLTDATWEVRAIAARSLGHLEATTAIESLEKLCGDQTWWVRMNAALALKRIGPKGIEILNAQKPNIDRYAYEIAQYVLALQE